MMIESIFKSFNVSSVTENHQGPLFWNLVSKKGSAVTLSLQQKMWPSQTHTYVTKVWSQAKLLIFIIYPFVKTVRTSIGLKIVYCLSPKSTMFSGFFISNHTLNLPITDTILLFQWLFPISEQAKNFVSKLESRWPNLHAFEAPPGLVTS